MELEITHPDSVAAGREFAVSFLIRNNGWEDKGPVSLLFSPGSGALGPARGWEGIRVDRIAAGGSYGETVAFRTSPEARTGPHFINLNYSHVLLENNLEPREAARENVAVALEVRERPGLGIHVAAPEAVFPEAEFPFTVELLAGDGGLRDVTVELLAGDGAGFSGQTLHSFSYVEGGRPLEIASRIATPPGEIQAERRVPFQVMVSYTDDAGERREDSRTVVLVLRPRTFMEVTADGGIWVGDLFIAPYVSLGTIAAVPAGALLSLAIRRRGAGKGKGAGGRRRRR